MHEVQAHIESLGITVSPELSRALEGFDRRTLARGEYFVREGEVATSIAYVVGGSVRHYHTIEGREYTRWVSLAGSMMAAFPSFVERVPSPANLVCTEATELLCLDRAPFLRLRNEYEGIKQLWMRSLEREMVKYEHRVTQLITTDSTERYLSFLDNYPEHVRRVPQKYIASMLGIEPRHLSRIRKKLASR